MSKSEFLTIVYLFVHYSHLIQADRTNESNTQYMQLNAMRFYEMAGDKGGIFFMEEVAFAMNVKGWMEF